MNTHRPVLTSQTTDPIRLRSTIDLIDILWRRKYVVFLAIVTAVALGACYYFSATRLYQSSADVLVVRKRPGVVTGDQRYDSGFEDYVATQRALIVSPLIVQRAIDTAGLGSLRSFVDFESEEDLTDAVIGMLEVGSGARDLGDMPIAS